MSMNDNSVDKKQDINRWSTNNDSSTTSTTKVTKKKNSIINDDNYDSGMIKTFNNDGNFDQGAFNNAMSMHAMQMQQQQQQQYAAWALAQQQIQAAQFSSAPLSPNANVFTQQMQGGYSPPRHYYNGNSGILDPQQVKMAGLTNMYGNMNMCRQETLNQGVRAGIAIANVFAASQQQQQQSMGPHSPHHHQQSFHQPVYPLPGNPGPPIQTGAKAAGPKNCNLFIFHLPNECTNQQLYDLFRPYGNIISVRIMIDNATGRSRGFGFVSYEDQNAADTAIRQMNGVALGGKKLKVQLKADKRANNRNHRNSHHGNHNNRKPFHHKRNNSRGGKSNNQRASNNKNSKSQQQGNNDDKREKGQQNMNYRQQQEQQNTALIEDELNKKIDDEVKFVKDVGIHTDKNIDVVEDEDQAKSIDSAATTTTTEDDEDVNVRIKFVQEVK